MGLKTKATLALLTASTTLMTATAAFAQDAGARRGWWWRWFDRWGGNNGGSTGGGSSNAVPEIDAGAGLLAIAAVLATLALVWELRRRRNKVD